MVERISAAAVTSRAAISNSSKFSTTSSYSFTCTSLSITGSEQFSNPANGINLKRWKYHHTNKISTLINKRSQQKDERKCGQFNTKNYALNAQEFCDEEKGEGKRKERERKGSSNIYVTSFNIHPQVITASCWCCIECPVITVLCICGEPSTIIRDRENTQKPNLDHQRKQFTYEAMHYDVLKHPYDNDESIKNCSIMNRRVLREKLIISISHYSYVTNSCYSCAYIARYRLQYWVLQSASRRKGEGGKTKQRWKWINTEFVQDVPWELQERKHLRIETITGRVGALYLTAFWKE